MGANDRFNWLNMPPSAPYQGTGAPLPSSGGSSGASGVIWVGLSLPDTVFDVSNSPVFQTGTLTGTFKAQAASTAFMGPVAGGDAIPTFRNILTTDISGELAGDVTGPTTNTRVERIWTRPVDPSEPVQDDVLRWDGAMWQVYPGLFGSGSEYRVPFWSSTNRITSTPAFVFDGSSILGVVTNVPNGPVRIEAQNTVSTGLAVAEVRATNNNAAGIAIRAYGAATSATRFGINVSGWFLLETEAANQSHINGMLIGVPGYDRPVGIGSNTAVSAWFYRDYVSIPRTTAASSTVTGALRVAGGVGIQGSLYVGGDLPVSGTIIASVGGLRITPGIAPSAPADGTLWVTDTGVFARVNGSTYQLTSSNISGLGTANQVTYWTGPNTLSSNSRFSLTPTTGAQQWTTTGHDWVTVANGNTTVKTRLRFDDRAFEIVGNNAPPAGNSFGSGCDTTFGGWLHTSWTGAGPGFSPVFKYSMDYQTGRHRFFVGYDQGSGQPNVYEMLSIGLDNIRILGGTTSSSSSTSTGALVVAGGVGLSGNLYVGQTAVLSASTATRAALRIPIGIEPDAANLLEGDIWTTTAGAYIRLNGSNILMASSLGTLSGSGTAGQVAYWSGIVSLTGDAGFTYDQATNNLTISTPDTNPVGRVQATTTKTASGAYAELLALASVSGVQGIVRSYAAASSIFVGGDVFVGSHEASRIYLGATSASGSYTAPIHFLIGSSVVGAFTGRGTTGPTYLSDAVNSFRIYYTVDSTSNTTGAVRIDGGLYVAKTIRTSALAQFAAATTARASFNVPQGVAPLSPIDGDMWSTTDGFYVRVNGDTRLISPAGVLTGAGLANQITAWVGSSTLGGNAGFTYNWTTGVIAIGHTTASSAYTNGALTVAGGVGISGYLNVATAAGIGVAAYGLSGGSALCVSSGSRVATFQGATTVAEIEVRQSQSNIPNVKFGISSGVGYVGTFSGNQSLSTVWYPFDLYSSGYARIRLTQQYGSLQFGHTTAEPAFRIHNWFSGSTGAIWVIQADAQTSGTYNTVGRWRQEFQSDRLITTMPDSTLGDRYFVTESRTITGVAKILTATHNDGRIGIARLPTNYRFEVEDGQPTSWLHNTYNGDDKVSLILSGTTATNRRFTGIRFTHPLYTTGWGADIQARDEGSFGTSLVISTTAGILESSIPAIRAIFHSSGYTQLFGQLRLAAATTTAASINVPHGVDPTTPINGDIWTTAAGVYARVNGTTITLSGGGGGSSGSGAAGQIAVWATSSALGGSDILTYASSVVSLADTAPSLRWKTTAAGTDTGIIGAVIENASGQARWSLQAYNDAGSVVRTLLQADFAGSITLPGPLVLSDTMQAAGIVSSSLSFSAPLLHMVPQSVAPTTPVNGDMWVTAAGVFARVSGATKQLTGALSGTGTANALAYWGDSTTLASVTTSDFDAGSGSLVFTSSANPEVVTLKASSNSTPVGLETRLYTGQRWVTGVDSGVSGWAAGAGFFVVRDRTAGVNRLTIDPSDGLVTVGKLSASTLALSSYASFAASTLDDPSFYLPQGVDPTVVTDGAMWRTSAGVFIRVGGTSINLLASSGGDISSSAFTTTTARLLGRFSPGAGAIETIQIGSGLLLVGGILSSTSGGGGGGASTTSPNVWTALNTFTAGLYVTGSSFVLEDIFQGTNPVVDLGTLFVNTGLAGGVITGLWFSNGTVNYQLAAMNAANKWTATNQWTAASTFDGVITAKNTVSITNGAMLILDSLASASNPNPNPGSLFSNFTATGAVSGLFFKTASSVVQVGALELNNVWTGNNTFTGTLAPTGTTTLSGAFAPNVTTWDAGAGSYTIAASTHVLVNSSTSTVASATVTFPTSPITRTTITIAGGANGITALTLAAPGGYTIVGDVTTLPAGAGATYVLVGTIWTRIQ